jgi:hypothetical protein
MKTHSWLKPIFLSLCFTFGLSSTALADQCSYITKEQALKAITRLNVGQTIYQFCEPCGDKIPTPLSIQELSAATVDFEDYWEVKVNGSNIDLAYIFIDAGINNQKINLAAAVGCPAANVSVVLPMNGKKRIIRQR